ncbi:hypothetical protein CRE_30904 [Caenorhabditis remanei]|uniref:Carboxylic ester hydrolase n=1 Tax=Caenorhabditis remanei TaxID=31234 RepID=E3LTF4_CAERE|nr:hypothetical protein CRE_30904 [Caenorhabditis remanei]
MGGFLSHLTPERNSEILDATCGPIRGNVYKHGEKLVDGYLGIPFAEPPGRFEKPIEAKVWREVKECTVYGPGCPQSGVFDQMKDQLGLKFNEQNCLSLNIFAPRRKSNEFPRGLPVMMNIFGGAFEMGTSAAYDDYSISGTLPLRDVIIVTVNYRVGALGFFTTGDEVCRGNFALWDQTLALKWIQKHIKSFGGDPSNVTVFGCSAGGVCADLLTLSTHSQGLFQKCVAMSGTADCEMACRSSKNQALIFKEFAVANGCKETDSSSILKWYTEQSMEVLNKLSSFKFSRSGFMSCAPNLDGDFFTKPLEKLREEAPKKSFIFGRTEFEGLIMAIPDPVYSRIGDSIPSALKKLYKSDVVEKPEDVAKFLIESYLGGIDESNDSVAKKMFIEFLGDAVYNAGILNSVESAAESGNNVFLYSFDFCNPDGYGPLGDLLDFKASTHGNDFRYVLGDGGYEKFIPSEQEVEVMKFMGRIFSNFAKYGDPNNAEMSLKWEKYSLKSPGSYFKIDHPACQMKDDFLKERLGKLRQIKRNKIVIDFEFSE